MGWFGSSGINSTGKFGNVVFGDLMLGYLVKSAVIVLNRRGSVKMWYFV